MESQPQNPEFRNTPEPMEVRYENVFIIIIQRLVYSLNIACVVLIYIREYNSNC